MTPVTPDRHAELDMLLQRAGIVLPPDRYPGVLAGFLDLQAMLPLLRQPRTAAAEPAGTYDLDTVTRGDAS